MERGRKGAFTENNSEIREEEEKMQEHSEKIIRFNGWEQNCNGLLSPNREVEKSFVVRNKEADRACGSVAELDRLCRKKKTRSIRPSEEEY